MLLFIKYKKCFKKAKIHVVNIKERRNYIYKFENVVDLIDKKNI